MNAITGSRMKVISVFPCFFFDLAGSIVCTECEEGKYSGVGATTCVDGLPKPDIEDELMQAAKNYPTCNCTRSWREIRQSKPNTRTGGLGEFMVPGKYEVWMCLQDNLCSTPENWFCYVFNEQTLKFEAWGFNSDVKVVKSAGAPGPTPTPALGPDGSLSL